MTQRFVGDGTRDGQHGSLGRLAAGPARQHVDNGFPDGREVGDLHIVDRPGLVAVARSALAQRKARIGAADIGEKNFSCLADTHSHLVAAALPAYGNLCLRS
ncbi:hypothetical protein ABIE89_006197 [Bradyrhizobium niftali]